MISLGKSKITDLEINPRVLVKNNITVQYDTCNHVYYDDDEYLDEDERDDCHKVYMPKETIQSLIYDHF